MSIVMHKKVAETPLECLHRLRVIKPELSELPMTYAGRFGPMADGVLLVLVGEECKHKEDFLGLDKEYVCEILWGVATDTYDILGKIIKAREYPNRGMLAPNLGTIPEILKSYVGKRQQEFPP